MPVVLPFSLFSACLRLFLCLILILLFHAQLFGGTLVHEFQILFSHTEWNLLFNNAKTAVSSGSGVLLNWSSSSYIFFVCLSSVPFVLF